MQRQHRQRDRQNEQSDRDEQGGCHRQTATRCPAIERDRTGGEREQQHRERVVRLPSEHEVRGRGADDGPAERAQGAIADERHDSGDHHRKRHRREQDQVDEELRPRLVAPARRRVQEPVHARPAVARLPDEVRDEQHGRDHHGQREAPRAQNVAPPDKERRDQQDEDDGDRVLRLEPDAGSDSEQRPRAAPERQPQREPEDDHRRQLVERDRLEEQVGRQHPRREADYHRGERLRTTRRPELTGDEGADQHRPGAGENRERAQTDERPAEQLAGQRREQCRHRRKLDVSTLQMQAGDGVVQLVTVPAVPAGNGELERTLHRHDDEHRTGRECHRRPRRGPGCHDHQA